MYELIIGRMERFECKSTNRPFSDDWVLQPKLKSDQMYSGINPSDAVRLSTDNGAQLEYTTKMLALVPMPVYARTAG